jgi:hypothetical protein
MCAVVMILSVYYVVATVPAAGTADQVTGVVTSQPIYSLTDATMGVGFMCPLVWVSLSSMAPPPVYFSSVTPPPVSDMQSR